MKYLVIISLLCFSCNFKTPDKNKVNSSIIGTYEHDGFNMSATLDLSDDRTFNHKVSVWSCLGGGDVEEFIGTYIIENNEVIFSPSYLIKSEYQDDSVAKRDSSRYFPLEHSFRDTLSIIQWENNVYLLSNEKLSLWGYPSKSDFFEFVNDINSGYYVHPNYGSYWRRKSLYASDNELKKMIPLPWRDLLLEEIMKSKTTNVEPYKSEREYEMIKSIVTIDKGSESGVKTGMKFYSDEKEDCACDIEIYEVAKGFSKGYAEICGPEDCKVGTEISTYLKREKKSIDYHKNNLTQTNTKYTPLKQAFIQTLATTNSHKNENQLNLYNSFFDIS